MPANPKIVEQMRDRQRLVFRVAMDPTRYGLTLKAIHIDSGLGYDSLRNYAAGDTIMPLTALDALVDVLPDELLSLLLPDGRSIVRVPDEIDHDAIASWAETYVAKKVAAHRKDSECEERIGPGEKADLDNTVAYLPIKGVVAA